MVLKQGLQKRIGLTFFIFSTLVVLLEIFKICKLGSNYPIDYFRIIRFGFYPIVYILSINFTTKFFRYAQVLCIDLEGLSTLIENPNDTFFGLLLILLGILIAYSYGYFNQKIKLKIILFSLISTMLFYMFPLHNHPTPLLSSIMWVVFIYVFLFLLWIIFKDWIDLYEKEKELSEEELRKSIKTLQKNIEEYQSISHSSKEIIDELLEIAKKYVVRQEGCDDVGS